MKLRSSLPAAFLLLVGLLSGGSRAHAITLRFSAESLERTLEKQVFKAEGGRYYLRGDANSPCFVFAEKPKVTFAADRMVIHVTTHAKLGSAVRGACLGIGLNTDADVSVLPEAEGETIGFHEPRIEHLTTSKELNLFLVPFLSHKLPQDLKLDAANLMRAMLANSLAQTGYDLRLERLKIHSMQVEGDALVVDLDGDLAVK